MNIGQRQPVYGKVLPVMKCDRPGLGVDLRTIVDGRDVLVIGSGSDIDGRGMGDEIDNGDRIVVRVNKSYGAPADVGTRTDVIFTRFKHWLELYPWFGRKAQEEAKCIIACNDRIGYTEEDLHRAEAACVPKTGTKVGSAGLLAVEYALHCGANRVDVIGFGWRNGAFAAFKEYTNSNESNVPVTCRKDRVDTNTRLDWDAEHKFYIENSRVRLID